MVGASSSLVIAAGAPVGEVFNVGSDHEITINALAAMVREMTESTSEIVHIPYDQAYADGFEDMRRRIPT